MTNDALTDVFREETRETDSRDALTLAWHELLGTAQGETVITDVLGQLGIGSLLVFREHDSIAAYNCGMYILEKMARINPVVTARIAAKLLTGDMRSPWTMNQGRERAWKKALATPCGERVFTYLLAQCGIGLPLSDDPGSVAKYNKGMLLLKSIQKICPNVASRIAARLVVPDSDLG